MKINILSETAYKPLNILFEILILKCKYKKEEFENKEEIILKENYCTK